MKILNRSLKEQMYRKMSISMLELDEDKQQIVTALQKEYAYSEALGFYKTMCFSLVFIVSLITLLQVRREKISERMKFLQDLVPGCSKVFWVHIYSRD